ncbi:hypothetical protein [uncultured Jannaschia sp.]|uniref:hypothetical protein n=1 Tax=uncultured Jannaschia sp. TaxID=293347 RepID=UPI0026225227|nr:hypothetical protein [uncultured Jannaschia sp.]
MGRLRSFALAGALALLPSLAPAAVLGIYTHDYGIGEYDPQGDDVLGAGFVEVTENIANPFFDSFDFSDLAGATIDSISLTIDFANAGPNSIDFGIFTIDTEIWELVIGGADDTSLADDLVTTMSDDTAPLTVALTASSGPAAADIFSNAVTDLGLSFWFQEPALFVTDSFQLASATLTVSGVSAVPLPAPFALLLAALGGLVLVRRSGSRCSPTAPGDPNAAAG